VNVNNYQTWVTVFGQKHAESRVFLATTWLSCWFWLDVSCIEWNAKSHWINHLEVIRFSCTDIIVRCSHVTQNTLDLPPRFALRQCHLGSREAVILFVIKNLHLPEFHHLHLLVSVLVRLSVLPMDLMWLVHQSGTRLTFCIIRTALTGWLPLTSYLVN